MLPCRPGSVIESLCDSGPATTPRLVLKLAFSDLRTFKLINTSLLRTSQQAPHLFTTFLSETTSRLESLFPGYVELHHRPTQNKVFHATFETQSPLRMSHSSFTPACGLLDLPPEIRNSIYQQVFATPSSSFVSLVDACPSPRNLTSVCR